MRKFLFSLVLCFCSLGVSSININGINEHLRNIMVEECTFSVYNRFRAENLVKEALTRKEICESTIFNKQEFTKDVAAAAQRGDTMASVYNTYCQKADYYFSCNSNFFHHLDVCLDKEFSKEVNEYTRLLNEIKNYICSDEGRLLERFTNNSGMECVQNKGIHILNCLDVYDKGDNTDICRYIIDVANCALTILKECSPEITPFFQGLFKVLQRHFCEVVWVDSGFYLNRFSKATILLCIFLYSIF